MNASERRQRLQRRRQGRQGWRWDAARATAAELKALRASSTDSSISIDDDRDNELKLLREAAREQAVQ
jgi:hypothetical protein